MKPTESGHCVAHSLQFLPWRLLRIAISGAWKHLELNFDSVPETNAAIQNFYANYIFMKLVLVKNGMHIEFNRGVYATPTRRLFAFNLWSGSVSFVYFTFYNDYDRR